MKLAFGAFICLAAALVPAAQAASVGMAFQRRDAVVTSQSGSTSPEFGLNLANQYLKRNGQGLPAPKDVKSTFPTCQWRHYNGQYAFLDDYNVSCYLSPSYKYHAYSVAKAMNVTASLTPPGGACFDTANPAAYPAGIPRYTMAVPYLYFNNVYDRRCKVRAMIKVPKTDEHAEYWVQAWVVEHDGGYWDNTGKNNPNGPQVGVLIDEGLYPKFFNKNQKDPDFKGVTNVEWFFLDINTIG
ncbi:hypothetical protein PSEUBRA_002872 [Kalmanozyma brasiliensis GHG001]|uniref:Uncharacterized protein n=1 Tax=Kalmanozyma brasiliensis (strain GHG001) TaxID=1365824 RepID=V5EWM1_KALBG|nr:uncharacterized protein PSEUBRA_002872 [Kalmanozyma brasiliensis GHG001]EST07768.1 hypothetical protein PSEUBRA_002872 [Kalmanozyma brasiliensis GHG001]